MSLSKEQEEWLDKIASKDQIRWRYGQPIIHNIFNDIPKELVTEEFCLAVVQRNCYLLFSVPEELKTEAVCLVAAEVGMELWRIPDKLRTEAVCIAAVKQDAGELQYVPKKLQSKVKAALKDQA